jgi:hypothetical protein
MTSLISADTSAMKTVYEIYVTPIPVTRRQLCEIIKTPEFIEIIHEDDRYEKDSVP